MISSSLQTHTQRKRRNRHGAKSTSMKRCRNRHQSLDKIIKIITNRKSSSSISKNSLRAVVNHLVVDSRISRPHRFRASILDSTSLSHLLLQIPHRRLLMTLVSLQPDLRIKWHGRETCLPKMWSVFSTNFRMSFQIRSLPRNVNSITIILTLCHPKSLYRNTWI